MTQEPRTKFVNAAGETVCFWPTETPGRYRVTVNDRCFSERWAEVERNYFTKED